MKLFEFHRSAELRIVDPAGAPMRSADGSQMWIRVRGEDAPEYQRLRASYLRKISARAYKPDPADAQEYELAVARALTEDWSIEGPDGPIKYTPEIAAELYRDNEWLANQVTRFGLERSNFLASSSRDS